MFQIGDLIAFCGLLAQTTAMLDGQPVPPEEVPPFVQIPGVPLNHTDLSRNLTSALSNGLLSAGLPDALKNLPLQEVLKNVEGSSDELNGVSHGELTSLTSHLKIIDVTITNPELVEVTLERSSDGHPLCVTIPLGMVLNVNVPPLRSLVKLDFQLNITMEVSVVKDEEEDDRLVLGKCTKSLGDLKISLLKGRLPVSVDKLLGKLTGLLSKAIPVLVQSQVCSLLNKVLGNLDVALVYNIASKLIPGLQFAFKL